MGIFHTADRQLIMAPVAPRRQYTVLCRILCWVSINTGWYYTMAMNDSRETGESELDVRGLICPLPVLRARKALMALQPGAMLRVFCTDPAAAADFPAFCTTAGHALVESRQVPGEQGPELTFLIRRGD
jgi:tRNA 2-thiouridine synthesizing protein A